jgi:aspartate/methionine/tyrosine aminotransferase
MALDALSVLGEGSVAAGNGAIYLFARLPEGMNDALVVERLIKEHRVTLIPGSSCGSPGFIRVAYANCTPEDCAEACARLKAGLETLLREHRSFMSNQQ